MLKRTRKRSSGRGTDHCHSRPSVAGMTARMAGLGPMLRAFLIGGLVGLAACTARTPPRSSMKDLVFLTREGCSNTATMRARLDVALAAMRLPADYEVLDLATVPDPDPRGGYPTPTLVYRGRDLFGMPEPLLPHPEPT